MCQEPKSQEQWEKIEEESEFARFSIKIINCQELEAETLSMPARFELFSICESMIATACAGRDARILELEAQIAMQEYAKKHDPLAEWMESGGAGVENSTHCGLVALKAERALAATTPDNQAWEQRKRAEVIGECLKILREVDTREDAYGLMQSLQTEQEDK